MECSREQELSHFFLEHLTECVAGKNAIFSFLAESIPSCHLGDLIPAGSRVSESHNASIVSSRSSTLISEISAIVIYISSVITEYILTEAIKISIFLKHRP
jgi:hypothetical protein